MNITRVLAFIIRKLWLSVAILLVTLALLLSLARLLLPYTSHYKESLVDYVSSQVGQPIAVESIEAGWSALGPVARLKNFSFVVENSEQTGVQVSIDSVDLELNFWETVFNQKPIVNNFVLDGVELVIDTQKVSQAQNSGQEIAILELLESTFLERFHRFDVTRSYITLISSGGEAHQIKVHQLKWSNQDQQHRSIGEFSLEGLNEDKLAFMIELNGSSDSDYDGQLYVKSDGVNLVPWLRPYLNQSVKNLQSKIRFEGWLNINKSRLTDFMLNLEPSTVSWFIGKEQSELELVSGNLQGQYDKNAGRFYLDDLSLAQGDEYWANINLQVEKKQQQWHLYSQRLNLQPLQGILPLLKLPPQSIRYASAVGGQPAIENLHFAFRDENDWLASGQLIDLSVLPHFSLPKLDGISASFVANPKLISVDWRLPEQQIMWPGAYQQQTLSAGMTLNSQLLNGFGKDWKFSLRSQSLQLAGQKLALSVGLQPDIEHATQVSAELAFATSTLADLKTLLPSKLLGQETHQYLQRALKSGQIERGRLIFEGKVADYPFIENQGKLAAQFDVKNAEFSFQPNWPSVTDLDLTFEVRNRGLFFASQQAQLLGAKLNDLSGQIPDVVDKDVTLTLDIDVSGSAQQATEILNNSTLKNSLGTALSKLNIEGPIKHQLKLVVPLLRSRDLNAAGQVLFNNNRMKIDGPEFAFTSINGLLNFDMENISAEQVSFDWGPVPYQVDLAGKQGDEGYQLGLDIRSNWDVNAILTQMGHLKMADRLEGNAAIEGHLALSFPKKGFNYRLDLLSDLQGLKLDLPAPFDKQADIKRFTRLTVEGDQENSQIKLNSGDNLYFSSVLPHELGVFSRAYMVLGQDMLTEPASGFNIAVYLPKADLSPYLQLVADIQADSQKNASTGDPILPLPERIRGRIGELALGPLTWHNTDLDLNRDNTQWNVLLRADEFDGKVQFNNDIYADGINIQAERLILNPADAKLTEPPTPAEKAQVQDIFKQLPDIDFSCKNCRYWDKNLGQLNFKLVRTSPQDISLQGFELVYRGNKIGASGVWRMTDKNQSYTRLKGSLSSDDFGWWLRDYQLSSAIRDSKADATFEFAWQNSPLYLNAETLSGKVGWHLGEGYLTEVSDKGARLLSLLSLDSLVRKLKLDFRDVFSKGLFYNSLKGDVKIAAGVAHTDNTYMDGVAGNMEVRGSTNLVDKSLDYKVKFSPKITSSLPILIAWMVNPVTGIAALAIDQVIESADVISQIEFSIHGTIDAPEVVETGRESKAIKIPKETQLKPQPK